MSTKILLADDSLTIQKVVELTFAETDHEVVAVSGGQDLLDTLGEVDPDIVICDVVMPGTDGYEVCQAIKSSPTTLHIPVILLTGTFEPFDRDRALAAGCDEIITKPFEARKLVEAVDRLTGVAPAEPVEAVVSDSAATEPVEALQPEELATPEAVPELVEAREPEEFPAAPEADEPADIAAAPAAAAGFAFPKADTESEVAFAVGDDMVEESEDALEFTTTGFAEMEEAGRKELGIPVDQPAEEEEPPAEEPPAEEPPFEEPVADLPEPGFEAAEAAEEDTDEDEEPTMVSAPEPEDKPEIFEAAANETEGVTTAPVDPPEEIEQSPMDVEEPLAEAEPQEEPEEAAAWDEPPSPFGEPEAESEDADAPTPDESASPEIPDDDGPTEPIETSQFAPPPVEAPAEPEYEPTPEPEMPAPVFAAAEAAPEQPEPEPEEPGEPEPEPEPEPEMSTPPPLEAPEPAAADTGPIDQPPTTGLSDEDIDRIARRVVELASERIEQIAWEVVPDMAELVVRERVREIEAKIEEQEDTVQ